ncbi:coagulation factor 5/8 type domain-containing protein [Streptosporangium sp. 'caverna']|nr:coagulation factor 5/8 type domain-containing protein [Streptosporangium sp. 'caverna']
MPVVPCPGPPCPEGITVRRPQFPLRALLTVVLTASAVAALPHPAAQAATGVVQAESYAAQSGVQVETTADTGGGQNVAYLAAGDWMRFDGVDLGTGSLTVSARVASAVGSGTVELRTGSLTGPLLAGFPITATGGWQSWTTATAVAAATHPAGAQTVFAVMRNTTTGDFANINWFSFETTAPAGTGWINVDQAAWNAQLAAFRAMTPAPVPANAVRVPEFNATCTYSHSRPDDPIIFPGLPGASHMHSFIGNRSTDAFTTTQTLLGNAGTSCAPAQDLSAYWIPTLYEHDRPIEPKGVIVYYGSRLSDSSKTVPFPLGFRMIAGDARSQAPTPRGTVNQFYCAGPGGEIGRSADGNWPVCAPTANLLFQLVFPDCWDGVHLDSPDHKSHLAYTYNGACGGDHPVAIPSVSFVIAYPASGTADGFRLASGMASSMHGDFFNAWDNNALGHRVKDCVVQRAKCNTAGTF